MFQDIGIDDLNLSKELFQSLVLILRAMFENFANFEVKSSLNALLIAVLAQ